MRNTKFIINLCIFMGMLLTNGFAKVGFSYSWFAEAYNETINFQRDGNNTITGSHLIEGIKLQTPSPVKTVEFYLKQRYGSDANRDYWNNRGEAMFGTRIRFFSKIYVAMFFEYIRGWYVGDANQSNPNPYGESYDDMRYGLIFWQGLDMEYTNAVSKIFPITFWDEIYADAIVYKRNDNNFISYINIRAGTRLARLHKTVFDPYLAWYYSVDSNKDFWNNKLEYGLGFRIKPWTDLELSVFIEFLNGEYIDRPGKRYTNPRDSVYDDRRFGILFWHGLRF